MNHRSSSRTRTHTPSFPEGLDEKDIRRRTISQIQQDVERELENADKILNTVDNFTGSRANSRTEKIRIRGDSIGKVGEADSTAADCYRASGQIIPNTGSNDSRVGNEECRRKSNASQTNMSGSGRGTRRGSYGPSYENPGGPYGQHSMHGSTGSFRGGRGGPNDPYNSYERAEGGYGRPGDSGTAKTGYGVQEGPVCSHDDSGLGESLRESHLQDGDPYAGVRNSGSSNSAARTMNYDQGRTSPTAPFDVAQDSTGRISPQVHYPSPNALSPRAGSPSGMPASGRVSDKTSTVAADRSPTGTQYSALQSRPGFDPSSASGYDRSISPTGTHRASTAHSRAGFDPSNPSGYDRSGSPTGTHRASTAHSRAGFDPSTSPGYETGVSLTGTQYSDPQNQPGLMQGDVVEFERPGYRTSPTGGSRSSLSRSPTNDCRENFGTGTKEQSPIKNTICPAARQGKCPAYAKNSGSAARQGRASGSYSSASKRPLSRIEEGPSSEEIASNEMYGQLPGYREEDFTPPSGGTCSQMESAKKACSAYPSRTPPRARCEAPGQPRYDSMVNDCFQSIGPRPQPTVQLPSRIPVSPPNHHHHDQHDHRGHDQHEHHHHDGESFHEKPPRLTDEKAISALNRLSQLQKTPSYYRCKFDRGLDFSSCDEDSKGASKMIKLPEKPCKGTDELQEMINCEAEDVNSVWYLTSNETKTHKKPCPKQQKAREIIKSIVKPEISRSCGKEYPPLEHPDSDDITPELAASMMFSQERGVKLDDCPDAAIKRFFPDAPRPPFPVKLSTVHVVDSNQEDQEEIIEKSAGVPSEGVSDSAYTRTMQNKGEVGAQKSYDIDFAIGSEKREYVLVAEKPQRYNKVQFRGNLPSWFPGYMQAFPTEDQGIKLASSPSKLFQEAWVNTNPENIPSNDVIVLE